LLDNFSVRLSRRQPRKISQLRLIIEFRRLDVESLKPADFDASDKRGM